MQQDVKPHNTQGWVIWGVAAFFVLYQFLLQNSPSVMSGALMRAFSIDAEGVGFLSSSFFYTYLLLQIPAGLLVDWLGARRLLIISPAACGVAAMIFAGTSVFSIAFVSRMMMGLVTAPAVAATIYLAVKFLPGRYFGLAAGLTEMMGMIGGTGEAYLGFCVEHFGWRMTMLGCGVLGFAIAFLMFMAIPDQHEAPHFFSETRVRKTITMRIWAVLRLPQAWFNGLVAGLIFTWITAFAGLWCVPYLKTAYHLHDSIAAYGSAAVFLGVAMGAPFMGWLGDRLKCYRFLLLVSLGLELVLLSIILYHPPLHYYVMLCLLAMTGFLCGAYILPFVLVRYFAPKSAQGTSIGFLNMMLIGLGALILQPFIGWILKHHPHQFSHWQVSDFQYALTVLLGCFLVAIVFVFTLKMPTDHTERISAQPV